MIETQISVSCFTAAIGSIRLRRPMQPPVSTGTVAVGTVSSARGVLCCMIRIDLQICAEEETDLRKSAPSADSNLLFPDGVTCVLFETHDVPQ